MLVQQRAPLDEKQSVQLQPKVLSNPGFIPNLEGRLVALEGTKDYHNSTQFKFRKINRTIREKLRDSTEENIRIRDEYINLYKLFKDCYEQARVAFFQVEMYVGCYNLITSTAEHIKANLDSLYQPGERDTVHVAEEKKLADQFCEVAELKVRQEKECQNVMISHVALNSLKAKIADLKNQFAQYEGHEELSQVYDFYILIKSHINRVEQHITQANKKIKELSLYRNQLIKSIEESIVLSGSKFNAHPVSNQALEVMDEPGFKAATEVLPALSSVDDELFPPPVEEAPFNDLSQVGDSKPPEYTSLVREETLKLIEEAEQEQKRHHSIDYHIEMTKKLIEIQHLIMQSNKGIVAAHYELGTQLSQCTPSCLEDRFLAAIYFKKGVDAEEKDSYQIHSAYELANYYIEYFNNKYKDESKEAYDLVKYAANKGHAVALLALAWCEYMGIGVNENIKLYEMHLAQATPLVLKLAKDNDRSAMLWLMKCHITRWGIRPDTMELFKCLKAFIKTHKNLNAYVVVARLFEGSDNTVMQGDKKISFKCLDIGIHYNLPEFIFWKASNLSLSIVHKKQLEKEEEIKKKEMMKLFKMAASQNHDKAICSLILFWRRELSLEEKKEYVQRNIEFGEKTEDYIKLIPEAYEKKAIQVIPKTATSTPISAKPLNLPFFKGNVETKLESRTPASAPLLDSVPENDELAQLKNRYGQDKLTYTEAKDLGAQGKVRREKFFESQPLSDGSVMVKAYYDYIGNFPDLIQLSRAPGKTIEVLSYEDFIELKHLVPEMKHYPDPHETAVGQDSPNYTMKPFIILTTKTAPNKPKSYEFEWDDIRKKEFMGILHEEAPQKSGGCCIMM